MFSPRSVALACLSLAAVLAAVFYALGSEPSRETAGRDTRLETPPVDRAVLQEISPRPAASGRRVIEARQGSSEASTEASPEREASGAMTGSVRLVSTSGVEMPVGRSLLDLRPVSAPTTERPVRVNVDEGGGWVSERVVASERYSVVRNVIASDGLSYIAVPERDVLEFERGAPNRIDLRCAPGAAIHVVDAVSGAPLSDLTLCLTTSRVPIERETFCHPPDERLIALASHHERSPIELAAMSAIRTGWVRSPDHAWGRFSFGEATRRVEVRLRRGASLGVEVSKEPLLESARVVVQAGADSEDLLPGSCLAVRPAVEGESLQIDGLPETTVDVCLVANGRIGPHGPFLDHARVRLESGRPASVVLGDSDADASLLAAVEVVVDPDVLGRAEFGNQQVVVEPDAEGVLGVASQRRAVAAPIAAPDGENGLAIARIEGLMPGRYRAVVPSSGACQTFMAVAGSTATVRFEGRNSTPVHVTVLNPDGSPRPGAELRARPDGVRDGLGWRPVGTTDAEGTLRFDSPTPSGSVLAGNVPNPHMQRYTSASGDAAVLYELEDAEMCEVEVVVQDRGEPVHVPLSAWYALTAERTGGDPGDGLLRRVAPTGAQPGKLPLLSADRATLGFAEPGEYEVTLGPLPSRSGTRRVRVVAHRGTTASHVLDL